MQDINDGHMTAAATFAPQSMPQRSQYDIAIVGAGIVGLATARELLLRKPGLRLIVVEKDTTIASQQSGHNSGVLHTGIYYVPGSLKAQACVEGHRRMLRFCEENGIAYELCGKLIVALNESELPRLDELYRRGTANGVEGLEVVGPERLREIEPYAAGIKAIYSPTPASSILWAWRTPMRGACSSAEARLWLGIGSRASRSAATPPCSSQGKCLVAGLDLRSRRRMSSPAPDCSPTR